MKGGKKGGQTKIIKKKETGDNKTNEQNADPEFDFNDEEDLEEEKDLKKQKVRMVVEFKKKLKAKQ